MSIWEFVIILLVALVVIKPERLPEISYLLGRLILKFRALQAQLLQKFHSN